MIFAPEQSYQLDYATCDYKEGVTGFSAKLLLSVRSWREKLRANPDARASPYQKFEHSVLMRGIKLCANKEGTPEQGGILVGLG